MAAWLYFAGPASQLAKCSELMLDLPGGGFVCMDPSHHDERIHHWAKRTGRPVLALDYAKAPGTPSSVRVKTVHPNRGAEYPYPYALHECFDTYRLLQDTKGSCIGFTRGELRIVLSGDSA